MVTREKIAAYLCREYEMRGEFMAFKKTIDCNGENYYYLIPKAYESPEEIAYGGDAA
jgi:hypothetical protein